MSGAQTLSRTNPTTPNPSSSQANAMSGAQVSSSTSPTPPNPGSSSQTITMSGTQVSSSTSPTPPNPGSSSQANMMSGTQVSSSTVPTAPNPGSSSQTNPSQVHIKARKMSARDAVLQNLFNVEKNDAFFPGISAFATDLQTRSVDEIRELDNDTWRCFNMRSPLNADEFWGWCNDVIIAFKEERGTGDNQNRNPAISAVLSRLLASKGGSLDGMEPRLRGLATRAMMMTLGWISTATMPVAQPDTPDDREIDEGKGDVSLVFDKSYNPATWIGSWKDPQDPQDPQDHHVKEPFNYFRNNLGDLALHSPVEAGFGPYQTGQDGDDAGTVNDELLHENRMTYDSLQRFGAISLKWVSTLVEHLHFNPERRELSVFQFPSVCAIRIQNKQSFPLDANITNWVLTRNPSPAEDLVEDHVEVYQEVLLSYRLLFGQTAKSRSLLKEALKKVEGNIRDPFLKDCVAALPKGRPWDFVWTAQEQPLDSNLFPKAVQGADGCIRDWNTYPARDNFPIFGEQLLLLQKFADRHPPMGFWDYVQDRRYPKEHFQSQVALFFGLFTLFFAAPQTVATIWSLVKQYEG
ncbi:uncharacterized protein DSM5745_06955 [Aspergillus mulundensis]|uniref:Uncharacterized protein n=1 Tax=Aspergillus mulundensis TaxID=1810919 RepID=A0A3D8RJR4_9EURO|nr:hypothetical protein DSM5745_06955 [Aspergillus mulundensis]RDW74293.1 hypothetical protein DSM5745_06955 [Aspergillus mulundensis]